MTTIHVEESLFKDCYRITFEVAKEILYKSHYDTEAVVLSYIKNIIEERLFSGHFTITKPIINQVVLYEEEEKDDYVYIGPNE